MLTRICDAYIKVLRAALILLASTLLVAVTLQVLGRYAPFIPRYMWTLEVSRFALIWAVFLGSIVGMRQRRHFFIDVFAAKPGTKFYFFLGVLYYIVMFTVTYMFIRHGYRYFWQWGGAQRSELTGISFRYLYASVPFAGLSWLLILVEDLWKDVSLALSKGGHGA